MGTAWSFGRLERSQSFLHEPEPNPYERQARGERSESVAPERQASGEREAPSIAPKRQRRKGSSAARIELPRAPGVSDHEQGIMEQCKKLWDELEGERTESSAGEQQRERGPSAQDVHFLRWLKQESDNYYTIGEPKDSEEMWVKLPEDRKKLYNWLKHYHDHVVLHKPAAEEGRGRSSRE